MENLSSKACRIQVNFKQGTIYLTSIIILIKNNKLINQHNNRKKKEKHIKIRQNSINLMVFSMINKDILFTQIQESQQLKQIMIKFNQMPVESLFNIFESFDQIHVSIIRVKSKGHLNETYIFKKYINLYGFLFYISI